MGKNDEAIATGTIIRRHNDGRGVMISAAITLPASTWEALTAFYEDVWEEANDDLAMRELTLSEKIALFLSAEADRWCDEQDDDFSENDFDDDLPF